MALLSIPNTLGAASIGYSVSCAVFGVMAVQLLIYFQRFPSDKLGYKLLVSRLFACFITRHNLLSDCSTRVEQFRLRPFRSKPLQHYRARRPNIRRTRHLLLYNYVRGLPGALMKIN